MSAQLITERDTKLIENILKKNNVEYKNVNGQIIFTGIDINPIKTLCEIFVDDIYVDFEGNIQFYSEIRGRNLRYG